MKSSSPDKKVTPVMAQWHRCKAEAKEALLLFRMGDFYEAFYEDAALLSEALGILLTQRQGIAMSGIPHHQLDNHLDTLVQKGFAIAIAEQIHNPANTKGLIDREVVRIITRGTLTNSSLIEEKSNNFIVALHIQGSLGGLAVLDVTTAEFRVLEVNDLTRIKNELAHLKATEYLFSENVPEGFYESDPIKRQSKNFGDPHLNYRLLCDHFKVQSLDGFGLKSMSVALSAAAALLRYLQQDLRLNIDYIKKISPYTLDNYLFLNAATLSHLELISSSHLKGSSLLSVIDYTLTAMGARLLKQWVIKPLTSLSPILERQKSIAALLTTSELLSALYHELKQIADIERLMTRIASSIASSRDLIVLKHSLKAISPIHKLLSAVEPFKAIVEKLIDMSDLIDQLERALVDEPALKIGEGPLFKEGYCAELDEVHKLTTSARKWLFDYQNELQSQSGIRSLKVNFNQLMGYYIEVSRSQAHLVRSRFESKQTLSHAERFTTPELREFENRIQAAEERKNQLERELFTALVQSVATHFDAVMQTASAIASIDALLSLAEAAYRGNYCRPEINESQILKIHAARHPVLEKLLARHHYIASDVTLADKLHDHRLALITGPNMAGKSTYLRTVALLVILAQIGSFVPAASMQLGIVDKLFTRIGAHDDLMRGQSTFMVEMSETANLLNNATEHSLVLLDEIGRGTSTFDGLSIAWSVAEYLAKLKARTLFATHYFELTELEKRFRQIVNLHALVQERDGDLIFLYQIVMGRADRSYGIQVAKRAGLPGAVLERAREILAQLEQKQKKSTSSKEESEQLLLWKLC